MLRASVGFEKASPPLPTQLRDSMRIILLNMAFATPAAAYNNVFWIFVVWGWIFSYANGEKCGFPSRWNGTWFQNGSPLVYIKGNTISTKGECIESSGDKFLIREVGKDRSACYRCVAIHEKHKNVLQYKETFCDDSQKSLEFCQHITGDAQLFSMFRVDASPVECPFKGAFTFAYSGGYKECKSPASSIDSCTEDWRILLRFQACPDVKGTESRDEELVCLANWKDGSTRYLVGKLQRGRSTSDEDKYRCFVYEKSKEGDNAKNHGYALAQSGDATCNGLSSPTEGSRTMKLQKVQLENKCHYPSWVIHSHRWHMLDGRKDYVVAHHNTTLRITNTTNATSATLEAKLVCEKELSARGDKTVTYVSHLTRGCENGYVCTVFHKRGHHVIELQTGPLARTPEEACQEQHFDKLSSDYVTLITPSPKAKQCPYLGKYNLLKAKWHLRTQRDKSCQGFSILRVGCERVDTIEFETDCPTEQKIETYECHANWHENGTNYLITSIKGKKDRFCFVYTEIDKVLQFSSLQESCKRNIQPGISGIMAFNVTSNGHCNEFQNSTSSKQPLDTIVAVLILLVLALLR